MWLQSVGSCLRVLMSWSQRGRWVFSKARTVSSRYLLTNKRVKSLLLVPHAMFGGARLSSRTVCTPHERRAESINGYGDELTVLGPRVC